MNHIYIPTTSPENWRSLLAAPEKQWRKGYSARELAERWEGADGFPPEVQQLFSQSDVSELRDVELLLAIPEYQVPLPGGSSPSQNDLFVLARAKDNRLAVMMVEGKVNEPFGPTLEEWLQDASPGKTKRLAYLCKQLGLSPHLLHSTTRYQLLHRTASALITAQRFTASYAIMIVHSFSQDHRWLEDYQAFLQLFDVQGGVSELTHLSCRDEISLYAGWVVGAMTAD